MPKMFLANQFARFCKSLLKKLKDQVDYLFAEKHQNFLQVSAIAFAGCGQVCPKYPK